MQQQLVLAVLERQELVEVLQVQEHRGLLVLYFVHLQQEVAVEDQLAELDIQE